MICVVCRSGERQHGTTTITFEREGVLLVVKEVPAEICMNCGEDYVDASITHEIMLLAEQMARNGMCISVRRYVPGSVTC
ncbi:zinc finger protein [Methanocalculus chunghsingensis]|uniref:Zinc finger protein n=1 Tax=Methanocalculus chunghsingensis TaxID=156457 RepID=A0A8J7W942_9EURY|nr:type II toxin-antitoxin system MqsA family antitoxin [Methanocalculus chunghsingensis]MBR1368493.1 zinc finger protein [Methanocalculus chunghsingensis]